MDGVQGSDLRAAYTDPIRQLLIIGETSIGDPADWPDYTADLCIGHEHVSALIGLACDVALYHGDSSSSRVWAPLHAWRALAQLRAEAGVASLLALLTRIEGDEAADLELPVVFGMIGPAAIPHIAAFMANRKNSEWSVGTAISGLSQIVARNAGCRGECLAILERTLEPHAYSNPTINGFAVSALLDLRAVEAIDTIRDAFRRNAIDLSIAGDIEDAEIELGLRDRRATPAPHHPLLPADWSPWPGVDPIPRDRPAPARREKVGRNAPCPCGSGKKYKKCCLQ